MMKPRDKFIDALMRKKITGRVPHFELVFFLTMEVFGKIHPCHRNYFQWGQTSEIEKRLHRMDMAQLYVNTARKFEHSAIFFHQPMGWNADDKVHETIKCLEIIRDISGDEYFTMVHGDATHRIPTGESMMEYINDIADNPGKLKAQAQEMVDSALETALVYKNAGILDGFALCTDYCLNQGPFLSPVMFDEFVTPYLKQLVAGYRELGFYTIKHSDGNIIPIIDSIIECRPDAIHSIDPQGGVDIAEVKRKYGDKVCIIGNVNCGLMDTGTDEQVIESARYCLKEGMPGGGYIFSTSNCIYTGMRLERYELIRKVWMLEGNYE